MLEFERMNFERIRNGRGGFQPGPDHALRKRRTERSVLGYYDFQVFGCDGKVF